MRSQLPNVDPESARHRFGKALIGLLHKSALLQMAANGFAPKASGAELIQLAPKLRNSRAALMACEAEKFIADASHASPFSRPSDRRHVAYLGSSHRKAAGRRNMR